MVDFDALKGKAEELLKEHGEKIEEGVEKAGEFAKEKFGHEEHVDTAVEKIKDVIPPKDG